MCKEPLLVGIFAEYVFDDHNGLLNHVVDLGLDQVEQGADTALRWLLEEEGESIWKKKKSELYTLRQ